MSRLLRQLLASGLSWKETIIWYGYSNIPKPRIAPVIRVKSMKYVKEEKTGSSSSKSRASYSSRVLGRGIIYHHQQEYL